MTDSAPQLRITVQDDEIIVTLPGYFYSVTYYKPKGSPGLIARDMTAANDLRISMTAPEFLTRA